MSRSLQRARFEQREPEAHTNTLPEISCPPEHCFSSCINEDYSHLPPLYLLQSASSQYLNGFYKSRGDIAMDSIHRRETCSWKPGFWEAPGVHGGAGEGAERLKKYNRCSSLISFPERSKFKRGNHYRDPVKGAPLQYTQRLSQLAAMECETIHNEKNRRVRQIKKC